jgi:molybdopterin converting factor small subunit
MSSQFTVKVLFFAAAQDSAGCAEVDVPCDKEISIETLLGVAAANNAGLQQFLQSQSFLVAIDENFATLRDIVATACEVAVLPPVSGG